MLKTKQKSITLDNKNITCTQNLSKADMYGMLEDYERITDIFEIKKGKHIRYLTKNEDNTYSFRFGGNITSHNKELGYIRLTNGSTTWSVQVTDTIFFAQLSFSDLKEEFKEELYIKDQKILEITLFCEKIEQQLEKSYNNLILLEKKYMQLEKKYNSIKKYNQV
jgi:hypothetical protein